MAVVFHEQVPTSLKSRTALKAFISLLFKKERRGLSSLSIIFCSDKFLLDINNNFLKHDFYTDIITFDLSDDPNGPIAGEIYISIERVRENARSCGVSFSHELHRVIFHGALHLCGYRDKTATEIKIMRQKEDAYLLGYFGGSTGNNVPRGNIGD